MVSSSARSRTASSASSCRMPVDADGHRGAHALRSRVEPEVEIDGKVVLFGKPVMTIDDSSRSRAENRTESGRTVPAEHQSDERDPASDMPEESTNEGKGVTEQSTGCAWTLFATSDDPNTATGPFGCFHPGTDITANSAPAEVSEKDENVTLEPSVAPATAMATADTDQASDWNNMFNWYGAAPPPQLPVEVAKGDDESTVDGHLFGELSSLPSVNGDLTMDGNSVQSTDFDGRDDHSRVRSGVDQKVHEIIVSTETSLRVDNESPSAVMYRRRSGAEEMSANNRRQMLIKELRSAIATYGRYDLRCANVSAALGDLLNETDEHEQAVKLHKDAVSIYSVKLGDDHSSTISAKFRLATVLTEAKEFDEAISTYYSVIAMRRALKGDKDPSVAECLARMAQCLKQNGEYQQAIKELKRALKIYRESLGDSNDNVSRTVDEIASLYVTLGDFEKSAAILEEVVKLKAATQGMQSKAVAETLLSLAMTYECSEHFTEAMKSLKKAYKIYTEIDGYSSEDATATLKKIAFLYEATGDYNRASIAFLGVLRGQKIHLGEDSLQVGETYCKLGHALRHTGQLEKALKCMKEALPIFVGKGVEMHDVERIAEIMHEMALIYKEKRHYSEAARIFKQELSVRRKIGQPEYPCIARTLNLLGVTEYEMKNNSRALKFLVESLTIYQQERNGLRTECAEVLFNTGLVFNSVRNGNRALEAFTESLRIFREQGLADDDTRLVQAEKEIAKIRQHISTRQPR